MCDPKSMKLNKINKFDVLIGRSIKNKHSLNKHYENCLRRGINNIKKNGRYPFRILFGCTEFCSALFSFLNLVSHGISYNLILRGHIVDSFSRQYFYMFLIQFPTWVSSTLFHINETTTTRNLDYFFAYLSLYFSLIIALFRVSFMNRIVSTYMTPMCTLILIMAVVHTYYLFVVDFNYKLNKLVCVFLFASVILSWLYICNYYYGHQHIKYLMIHLCMLVFAGVVEMMDIPPLLYLMDSHAIFHLITVFSAPFYYLFARGDVLLHFKHE